MKLFLWNRRYESRPQVPALSTMNRDGRSRTCHTVYQDLCGYATQTVSLWTWTVAVQRATTNYVVKWTSEVSQWAHFLLKGPSPAFDLPSHPVQPGSWGKMLCQYSISKSSSFGTRAQELRKSLYFTPHYGRNVDGKFKAWVEILLPESWTLQGATSSDCWSLKGLHTSRMTFS